MEGVSEKGPGTVVLKVKVKPRASRSGFNGRVGDSIKLDVKAPPVEGAANKECIKFLSKTFRVSKSSVRLISGQKARDKAFEIHGINEKDATGIIRTLLKE